MKRIVAGVLLVLASLGCSRKTSDRIVVYGRENNSGTYAYFKEHVLNEEDFASFVQTLPGTAAVINAVSKDPKSIGYGGIGYSKGVRAIAVKKAASSPAVEPTMEAVVNGSYPISRNLYFYTVGEPTGAVRDYFRWVLSSEGQQVCRDVGYYPLPKERIRGVPGARSGERTTITVKGSDTMIILGQRWAENYMKKYDGVVIQTTGGGSGTGIAALIDGRTHICQASRPMKEKEKKKIREKYGKDAIEIAVALDGLAVFVHESNPIKELTLAQLKAIYRGKTKSWKDLGRTEKK